MEYHYPFSLLPLPYSYEALEPYIDTFTMKLHHDRHLKTYVDNLNAALSNDPAYQNWTLEQLIFYADCLPKEIQTAVINNAGGVYNHNFYFANMSPKNNSIPTGFLTTKMDATFGSYNDFKKVFQVAALDVFGSGYAWLVADSHKNLKIMTTHNQETPLTSNAYPLLTIDVWEHAYYLKHYNKRVDYIADWFHVANFDLASKLYEKLA